MRYFIWQVPGQLKSECLATDKSFEELRDSFFHEEYGLREVDEKEYREEVDYNSSSRNPWN
ncbi:hypothetical protein PCC6912_50990 [Chlorogloeopsis fritschii PCC 6912]|uniref:Uncharacterized protein n=1 Tax=Chlorogloeopsis fritschii PCC 6912 TaxID=211165 RepID=A0A433N1R2_CHLFR|nr:hypothetical protein PCC6912_50990 [Chlorogloeopsis fritschii PCC 6912]